MGHTALVLVVLGCLSVLALVRHRRRVKSLPYPPGPAPTWLLGNIKDIPSSSPWLRFSEWAIKYGDITYVTLLGQPIVILNSLEACKELLEKRGATTAGRPYSVILGLMGLLKGVTQHQDTARWRYQRKLTHSAFGPQAVKNYHPIHELHVAKLIKRLVDPSSDCVAEVRLAIGKIIFAITYGLPIDKHFDEFRRITEAVGEAFTGANIPGRYLVDSIPILRHVPESFPGAYFRRYAAYISGLAALSTAFYYDEVKNELATGNAPPSFVSNCLSAQAAGEVRSQLASREEEEDALAWAASSMYRAGTITTEQVVVKFLTAMQLYPDIQRKAQAELARVVGTQRMPTVADRDSLPYVNAVILESLRWHVAITLGVPHRTAKDEVYKGYFIPRNTTILFNAWNLSLQAEDGSAIDNPEEFIPERFLSGTSTRPINPDEYAFGFGRRICLGRHIAHDILFLLISGILSSLWISKPAGEHGEDVPLHIEWSGNSSVSYPSPVHPRFVARLPTEASVIDYACGRDSEEGHGGAGQLG